MSTFAHIDKTGTFTCTGVVVFDKLNKSFTLPQPGFDPVLVCGEKQVLGSACCWSLKTECEIMTMGMGSRDSLLVRALDS